MKVKAMLQDVEEDEATATAGTSLLRVMEILIMMLGVEELVPREIQAH